MSTNRSVNPPTTSADFATPTGSPKSAAPPLTKEDFARRWGFASFLEMFEASTPVGKADGKKKWLLTALRGGKFLLWNDGEIGAAQEFESREEALARIPADCRDVPKVSR
jgi:hypothetical protein